MRRSVSRGSPGLSAEVEGSCVGQYLGVDLDCRLKGRDHASVKYLGVVLDCWLKWREHASVSISG